MASGIKSLSLAYLGDAVYELKMRELVIKEFPGASAAVLHKENTQRCCAHAQSELAGAILEELTEEELAVYKTARNHHPGTIPKNQSMSDYRRATGLEALIGYLYLEHQEARIDELIAKGLEICNMKN